MIFSPQWNLGDAVSGISGGISYSNRGNKLKSKRKDHGSKRWVTFLLPCHLICAASRRCSPTCIWGMSSHLSWSNQDSPSIEALYWSDYDLKLTLKPITTGLMNGIWTFIKGDAGHHRKTKEQPPIPEFTTGQCLDFKFQLPELWGISVVCKLSSLWHFAIVEVYIVAEEGLRAGHKEKMGIYHQIIEKLSQSQVCITKKISENG